MLGKLDISERLIAQVGEAEAVPRFYGLAYREFDRLIWVCYPIPLNLIVRAIFWVYWKLVAGIKPLAIEKLVSSKQQEGYSKGYSQGMRDGEEHELMRIQKELRGMLKAYL